MLCCDNMKTIYTTKKMGWLIWKEDFNSKVGMIYIKGKLQHF